ncbi:MAG: asparaginase [Planctomycetota bacterium]
MAEIRLTRGSLVESRHQVSFCVWRNGEVVRSSGDVTAPVFYRSAAKPLQAIAVVESGAPDRFGFTDEELAMVVGSHDGAPANAAAARSMLGKIGVTPDILRCGGHRALNRDVYEAYVREGHAWGRLEDNCSGKHSGMIAAAVAMGADPTSYAAHKHPVQQANVDNVSLFTGVPRAAIETGIDGCAVPSFGVPLPAMAQAIARFTTPGLCPPEKQEAVARIRGVVAAFPEMVAGPKRFDTIVMRATGGALLSKEGAEGVVTIGVADESTGIAIKVEDGAQRALNAFAAALLADLDLAPRDATARWFPREILSRAGDPVGAFEVAW